MNGRGYFVTGTDTGVGKTRVAATLCQAFALKGARVAGMKPVSSGCRRTPAGLRNDDALALLAAMNVPAAYAEVNPYAFEPAIAPHIAAREAGCTLHDEVLDQAFGRLCERSDVLIVEGAGGWLAPLDATRSFADLAVRWQLPVILVVGLRLGCLNHALLTAEAVQRRGLPLAGWVGNAIDSHFERRAENVATLQERLPAPCWGILDHAPAATAVQLARRLAAALPATA